MPASPMLRVVLWAGALLALVFTWLAVCVAPAIPWNLARLTVVFALADGMNPYALPGEPHQLAWFYGPVLPLVSLPVTLLPGPTSAMVGWAFLNAATQAAAFGYVVRELLPVGRRALAAVLGAALFFAHPFLHGGVVFVHVDGFAAAFGLVACVHWVRATARTGRAGVHLHVAALAVALAVWSKQLSIVLAPALLAWGWHRGAGDLARRLAIWMVIYAGTVALLFVLWFGADQLIFNLWVILERMPWRNDPENLRAEAFRWLGGVCCWALAMLVLAIATRRARRTEPLPVLAALLLWVAVAMFPLGVLAALKVGGGLNSVHSLMYALPVVACFVAARCEASRLPGLAVSAVLILGFGMGLLQVRERGIAWMPSDRPSRELEMVRGGAGRLYLPWSPLAMLLGTGKLAPFDNGLFCAWAAGYEISAARVRAAAPSDPVILYNDPVQSTFALRYFPAVRPQ